MERCLLINKQSKFDIRIDWTNISSGPKLIWWYALEQERLLSPYAQTSYFFNSCPKPFFVFLISGSSYCPSQCASTACQAGCDPSCCTPTSSSNQMQYPSPAVYGQSEPIYPSQNPWQCPVACTRNVNFCPPYCSSSCCNAKRRTRVKIHKF